MDMISVTRRLLCLSVAAITQPCHSVMPKLYDVVKLMVGYGVLLLNWHASRLVTGCSEA
jgi:hypothetical protein